MIDKVVAETTEHRDALGSLMRNFGFVLLYYGKGYSSRKHSGVNHNTFFKHFSYLTEDISKLSPEDRQIVARRFLSWALSAAIFCSGEHLNNVFNTAAGSKEQRRAAIKDWIELLSPAIRLASTPTSSPALEPSIVIDALLALDAGEQVELFSASPKIGKQANSYTLYKHRFQFLYLQSRMKRHGLSAQKANKLVEKASRTSSDTMRKWEKPVNRHLCAETVRSIRAELKTSIRDSEGKVSIDLIRARLDQIGEDYRAARGKKKGK